MCTKDCGDFIQCLGTDVSIKILMNLEDIADLVRVSSVSSSWRRFVIANRLCKMLSLRMFPEISGVEVDMIEPVEIEPSDSTEWRYLERDYRVYAFLARGLSPCLREDCLEKAISASSTDNFPDESVQNTLEPSDRVEQRASYWSSEGESDPKVPETLVYKLCSNLCVITEIHVQPFQAYFQLGFPIYSSKTVRFRMGRPKNLVKMMDDQTIYVVGQKFSDDRFIWTYSSPEFPMAQENCLQKFRLPQPVLCLGGTLQVELLGRVQRQEMDGLYYICISHVQVVGRPLLESFDVSLLDPLGKCRLKYRPKVKCSSPGRLSEGNSSAPSRLHSFTARLLSWEHVILAFLGPGAVVGDEESD